VPGGSELREAAKRARSSDEDPVGDGFAVVGASAETRAGVVFLHQRLEDAQRGCG